MCPAVKVLVALGTRPEVIKLAPVIRELKKWVDVVVCATGQHREILTQALDDFDLCPDVMLATMSPGRSLNILAARVLEAIDGVLETVQPDWVLVQGDTTTAFCAGLAAFHRSIRIGHIEAGLRTGNLQNPFPEEANRRLLGCIADLHFAPTRRAANALRAEGVPAEKICISGNSVVDAIDEARQHWSDGVPANLADSVREVVSGAAPLVLVTCHRRENFGEVLENICQMLLRLCAQYSHYQWVFPVHPNPCVRGPVTLRLGHVANLKLVDPLDYHSNLYLISKAHLVVSDSGGIQEEAPTFGTPVVVMRQYTERMEGVDAGFATLAGQDPEAIEAAIRHWLEDTRMRAALMERPNPYGDGLASRRIAQALNGQAVAEFNG